MHTYNVQTYGHLLLPGTTFSHLSLVSCACWYLCKLCSAYNHSVYTVCTQWFRPLLASLRMLSGYIVQLGLGHYILYTTYIFFRYGHFLSYGHSLVPCCPDKRGFTVYSRQLDLHTSHLLRLATAIPHSLLRMLQT